MRYQTLGESQIKVSAAALGTWGIGGGTAWRPVEDRQAIRLIHRARELGVNLIDTAPVYGTGHSEELVGKALQGRRGDYVLATKCAMQWRDERGQRMYVRDGKTVYRCFAPDSLAADLEDSLRRLGTDYIDLYIIHRQPDDPREVAQLMETLKSFQREGKIREIGISNASPDYLLEYLRHGRIALVQEKFSLLDQRAAEEYLPLCREKGVVFQGYSALERGLLTGTVRPGAQMEEAARNLPWMQPQRQEAVLQLLEGWKPLCKKYACSLPCLVLAATFAIGKPLNLLIGARRTTNLEDSLRAVDLEPESADLDQMRCDCAALQNLL